jgi:hypothetical protein
LTLFKLLMVAACMAMAVTMVMSQLCVRKIKTGVLVYVKTPARLRCASMPMTVPLAPT